MIFASVYQTLIIEMYSYEFKYCLFVAKLYLSYLELYSAAELT